MFFASFCISQKKKKFKLSSEQKLTRFCVNCHYDFSKVCHYVVFIPFFSTTVRPKKHTPIQDKIKVLCMYCKCSTTTCTSMRIASLYKWHLASYIFSITIVSKKNSSQSSCMHNVWILGRWNSSTKFHFFPGYLAIISRTMDQLLNNNSLPQVFPLPSLPTAYPTLYVPVLPAYILFSNYIYNYD